MPRGVLVDPKAAVEQEYYAGVVWDGIRKQPVMLFSDMGGIDIEEVAEEHPDHVGRGHFSTILPFSDFQAKEVIASVGVTGSRAEPARPDRHSAWRSCSSQHDMTLAEINPLGQLQDGSFVALDAHMDMENEARGAPEGAARATSASATRRRARPARRPRSSWPARRSTPPDHRGVAGNVTEFDGDLGLVIGAGGGSLTLFDAVRAHGGQPGQLLRDRRQPVGRKACGLAKLVLQKPGVDKIAVMMSIVSNTRVDIVARGVIKACLELGHDPAREDLDLPHPGRVGGGGLQDPRALRRALRRPQRVACTRRRGWRSTARRPRPHEHPRRRDTTFIVQGITGREAVNLTRECLDYGAGAQGRRRRDAGPPGPRGPRRARLRHRRPGRRPPRRADRRLGRDRPARASPRTPCSRRSRTAIKLIVIVTERIPRADVAQMVELGDAARRADHRAQLPGHHRPRRDQDGRHRRPGQGRRQGLHARPDRRDLALGRHDDRDVLDARRAAGLGQSTAVSIGGDAIIGSTYAELMPLFEADEQTQGIVIYTEPGGRMEAELARWVTENDSRLPIVAFMAGRFMDEMPGMSFGHAGTIVEGKEDTAAREDRAPGRGRHHRGRGDLPDPGDHEEPSWRG